MIGIHIKRRKPFTRRSVFFLLYDCKTIDKLAEYFWGAFTYAFLSDYAA